MPRLKIILILISVLVAMLLRQEDLMKHSENPSTDSFDTSGVPVSAIPSSLPVVSTPSRYPNIRIHPNPLVQQSEMSIVVDPSNSRRLLVGDNTHIPSNFDSIAGQGYYFTTDAGLHWIGSDTLTSSLGGVGDPSVAIDADGNSFFSFLRGLGNNKNKILIKKFTNGAASWGPDLPIDSLSLYPDKDHLTIDVAPLSPFQNRVYSAWTDGKIFYPRPVKLARSSNGGVTFNDSVWVSGNTGYQLASGVNLAVGINHEVFAAWVYYDTATGRESALGFNISTDAGQSWNIPGFPKRIVPTGFSGIRGFLSKGSLIRVRSYPSMDVDRTNGPHRGSIYITWANGLSDHTKPDIMLIKSGRRY
jgi:hypothetical protein